ncbi:MAG: alpha/beta hydrolase [Betaproteobacteria bacterium]|nr:alpha/beta hydrolase [Betaproteobacteria bacterium]
MPFADTETGTLHYEVTDLVAPWVERPGTIIFHHGIGGSAGMWAEWLPHLIDRYRIVRFDMRGYGRSNRPAPGFKWSLDGLSRDVLAIADAIGVERPHVLGESIGGTIALNYALQNPQRIATLTMSNAAHVGLTLQKVHVWKKTFDDHGVKGWSDIFMRDRFHEGVLDLVRWTWFATMQEAWEPAPVLNALGVLVGTDLRPAVAKLACPLLIMHPDGSPFIPVETVVDLHQRLPGSSFNVIGHSKHGMPFSHARECATKLREFLDAKAPRSS